MNKRWTDLFAGSTWLDMISALYEGPGSDWEGGQEAFDQLLYELAKARGLDATQACPRCKKIVDQAACADYGCEACERADEERHEASQRALEAAKQMHIAWLAGLPPEEREEYERRAREEYMTLINGMIARDVQ